MFLFRMNTLFFSTLFMLVPVHSYELNMKLKLILSSKSFEEQQYPPTPLPTLSPTHIGVFEGEKNRQKCENNNSQKTFFNFK